MGTMMFIFIMLAGLGLIFFLLFQQKRESGIAAAELETGVLEEQQVEEMIHGYLNALMKNPDDVNLRFNLADVQVKNERVKEGLGNLKILFEKGLDKMPRLFFQALLLAAEAERRSDNRDGQRGYLKQALRLNPLDQKLNIALGKLEYEIGNFKDAAERAGVVLQGSPDSMEANLMQGQVLYRQGELDQAVPFLERVLEVDPGNVQAILFLGKILSRQNRVDDAAGWFNRALEFVKEDEAARVYFDLGCLYRRNSRFAEAEKALREVLVPGIDGEISKLAMKELCALYKEKKDVPMVIWALKDIIVLEPDNDGLREELALYMEMNSDTRFQKYTMLGQSGFEKFCVRIAQGVVPKAKLQRSEAHSNGSVEVVLVVREQKKPEIVLFRFVRMQNPVGTVELSDVYASMKRYKAEKGYMVAPAGFTDPAREYAQMRMMVLVDRVRLLKLLSLLKEE